MGDNGHSQPDEEFEIKPGSSPVLQPMPEEMSNWRKTATDRPQGAYRKFHPDRVAELGLSSLGKPVEVLVLQHRDRRLPETPVADEGEKKNQVMETLQAETAPLDPEQVRHNIDQIKKSFGDAGQILDKTRWKELRHNLFKGFTHIQLLDYVRHMEHKTPPTPGLAVEPADASSSTSPAPEVSRIASERLALNKSGSNNAKKRAALFIMKNIWGFSFPAGEEEAEDMQSVTVPMSRSHLGFFQAQGPQPFTKLSKSLKVDIKIFYERSQLVISGSPDAIDRTKATLGTLKRQIATMNIDLRKEMHLSPIVRDDRYAQALVEEAGRNRGVYIERKNLQKGGLLRLFHHQTKRQEADAVRREILLAGRRLGSKHSMSIWPPLETQSTWLVPYTPWQALPWWESLSNWGRWNFLGEPGAKATESSSMHGLARKVYERLRVTSHGPYLSPKSGPITHQHTALFGQALFPRDSKQQLQSTLTAHQQPSLPPRGAGPKIVTDIPLLAQSLASCKSRPVVSKEPLDSRKESSTTREYLHRLLLLPATAAPNTPAIHVFLKGDDMHLGLRQPLRLHSISAVLEERSHIVLLPERGVDLDFRRQTLYHIYSANRRRDPHHNPFNEQFLSYLNQAQGKEVPSFAPLVNLHLPFQIAKYFQRPGSRPSSTPTDVEGPSEIADEASPAAQTAPSKTTRKAGATEYLLAASESVEVASFSHNVTGDLCLDNVHFSAMDGTQSRQELRLAERPYPDTQTSSVPFPTYFDCAYAVALWLGDAKFVKEGV